MSRASTSGGWPRIVVIDVAFRENGGIRVMIDLAARWHRLGVPVEFFVMQKPLDEAEGLRAWAHERVPVRYGSTTRGRLRQIVGPVLWRFLQSARKAELIVSVCEDGYGLLLGSLFARLLRKPFVAAIHSPVIKAVTDWTPPMFREPTFAALRKADMLICVAEGCIADLLTIGCDPARIRVIRNGIDVEHISRNGAAEIEPPLPVEIGRPLVVATGRLAEQKGFDLLLRAHARLLAQGVAHHLVIAGEGPERAPLEQLIDELGVTQSVRLLGFRPNPHALMARADLFCMSSRYEGFPLALIEAMSLGVPIVSANCVSGPSEVLADGEFGDLVEANSVEALADGIARHLQNPERLREIAKKGPARARSFDPDKAAADYLELFGAVVH